MLPIRSFLLGAISPNGLIIHPALRGPGRGRRKGGNVQHSETV
jgi:hypothetical protein